MGDANNDDLRVSFDSRLKLKFLGSQVTTDAPDKFTGGSGNWRFEGTLVRSEGREHDRSNPLKLDRDGMHPGGTVIDKEQGVQYIYIYLGHFPGPAGIFQIKRTLDTDALREYLLKSRSAISQH